MKVIKSYWKSCLCFLLAFLCILSLLIPIISSAYGGAASAIGGTTVLGSSHGYSPGLANTTQAVRVGIFDIDDATGWFSVSGNSFTANSYNADMCHYDDADYWCYFTPSNQDREAGATLDIQGKGTCTVNTLWKADCTVSHSFANTRTTSSSNSAANYLLSQLGLTTVSGMTTSDLFNKFDTYFRGLKSGSAESNALLATFGITSDQFLVVVELVDGYTVADSGVDIAWMGRLAANYNGKSVNNSHARMSEAPYGYNLVACPDGVGLYGDPVGGKKSGSNIMVTYTGETNTSDTDKFTSAGTFALAEDGALHTWNGSGWSDDFTVNMSTTGSEYSIIKAGKAKLTANGVNVNLSSILAKMNNLGGFNLRWGTENVTGGDFHAGVTTSVSTINGNTTAKPIVDKLNGCVDGLGASWGESLDEYVRCITSDSTGTANLVRGIMAMAYNSYTDDKALTKGGKLRQGKSIGLGVEFLVKGTPVTSTHYKIAIKTDGSTSVSKVTDINYTTANSGMTDLTDEAICVVVAKKTDANNNSSVVGQSFPDTSSPNSVLSTLESRLTDRAVSSVVNGGESIVVGSTTVNTGYVIYEVVTDAGEDQPRGKVDLEDWFLNKYIDNIIDTSSKNAGNQVTYKLKQDNTDMYNDLTASDYTTALCGASLLTHVNQDYNIIYTESSNGTEISWDDSISKKYYPASSGSTYPSTDSRYKFKPNLTIDTKNLSGETTIDYAFNFVRSSVDDVRSFSGISYSSYESLDADNLLKMKDKFGVVPTVKSTSVGKNQLVGTITENLVLETKFKYADGVGKKARWTLHYPHVYRYDTVETDSGSYTVPVWCSTYNYIDSFENHACRGIWMNAFPVKKMNYNFDGFVYKYQTANKDEGKNSLLGNSDMKALGTNASIPTGATKKNTNEYRYATVHRNAGVDLKFYPENYMVYKIGETVFDSAPYKYAAVMSEVKRTAESSSLYLFKINTDVEDENSVVTGSTYSDTMQGGTSSFGKNQVSIPAGSDVTVLADATNIKLDLYGYALDLIDGSKDSTMSIGAGSNKTYNSVVKSGENVASAWGNASDHSEKLKSNFITWVDNILQVENFGADFVLKVNNQVKGANFSATVGKVNHTSGAVEDGVYNIVVENGEIVKSAGAYNNMIQQIAADYDCSTAEAETIFTDSQIYTAIMNAIESSTSNFNTSGQATGVAESWTSTLGNANNWYDEKVRTFVVRRYTNLGNTLSDITATDKLDYSLAPNGDDSGKENAGAGTTYNANWYLNIFFNSARKDTVDSLLLENSTYYDPSVSTDISGANNAYSVLIKENHVKDADFLIPASSTSSFGF